MAREHIVKMRIAKIGDFAPTWGHYIHRLLVVLALAASASCDVMAVYSNKTRISGSLAKQN